MATDIFLKPKRSSTNIWSRLCAIIRPRLLGDEQGHNFWVVDGQTSYKRPTIKGAGAPGTAAPPGKALQSARRASPGSQTLNNLKERLDDLDREKIDLQFIYPSFLLHANAWPDGILANGICRAYNTWLNEACNQAPDRLQGGRRGIVAGSPRRGQRNHPAERHGRQSGHDQRHRRRHGVWIIPTMMAFSPSATASRCPSPCTSVCSFPSSTHCSSTTFPTACSPASFRSWPADQRVVFRFVGSL